MPKKKTLQFPADEINSLLKIAQMNKATLSISISGNSTIDAIGSYTYTVSYGLSDSTKTVSVVSATAELDKEYSNATISDVTTSGFKLNVTSFSKDETVSVKFTVEEKNSGTSYQTINVTLDAIPVTDFTVTGTEAPTATGDYDYTLTPTPSNANIGIADLSVEVGEPQSV